MIHIRGANIIDGTGKAPFTGDILVSGGKIVHVGRAVDSTDATVLLGAGLTATPGFIDAHTHNELYGMAHRQQARALTQGITTEIVAQCGLGLAPADSGPEELIRLYAGIVGEYNPAVHTWRSFDEYLTRLGGAGIHATSPITHSALRANAVGHIARKATARELDKMCSDAARAMEEGAVGFSTGLTYYPAGYGDTDELIAICRVVREHDGVFLVHKRDNFGYPRDLGDDEAVRVLRETGVRTHILHIRTGMAAPGDIDGLLQPYRAAINDGLDISFEFYPYLVGAGFGLVFLPPWAMEGGYQAVLDRTGDRGLRKRIVEGIRSRYEFLMSAEGATFAGLPETPQYIGRTFREVSAERGQNEPDMICDLLYENKLNFGYRYNPPGESEAAQTLEDDFFRLLDLPFYTIGSDAIAYGQAPHPRATGTFPRLLRMARERGYPLERLIHKITMFTAGRYRLAGKGTLAPGMDADISLFDYGAVRDNATFGEPLRLSDGMRHVLVDGELAMKDGGITGRLNGKALRRGTPI